MDEAEPPFDLQRAKVNIARFVAVKTWIQKQIERWDWCAVYSFCAALGEGGGFD